MCLKCLFTQNLYLIFAKVSTKLNFQKYDFFLWTLFKEFEHETPPKSSKTKNIPIQASDTSKVSPLKMNYFVLLLRIRSIFSGSGSADPVLKIRIRIRIRILLNTRYVFDVQQKKYFLWHFLTKSKHHMTLKIKDKKLFGRNCILDNFITRKFE